MSAPDPASPPPVRLRPPEPPPRNGCLTALMVLVGLVLLLPGVCALGFGFSSNFESGIMPFVIVGLLIAFGGVMLIRAAIRGPR
jgi:hypothetical protein